MMQRETERQADRQTKTQTDSEQLNIDSNVYYTRTIKMANNQVMEFVCSKKGRKRTNIVIIEKCRSATVVQKTDFDCQSFADLPCHVPIVSFTFSVMKEIQKE